MHGPESRPDGESEALKRENASLRAIANHLAMGVWCLGHNGDTVFASRAMCDLLEINSPEELRDRPASDFLDEDGARLLLGSHPTAPTEVMLIGDRGTRRQVSMATAMHTEDDGAPRLILTFTDRRDARARPSNAPLDLARDAAQMALFEWDIAGDRVDSRFAGQSTNFNGSLKDALTRNLDAENGERLCAEIDAALGDPTRDALNLEYQAMFPDGSRRWRMATARILRDGNGKAQRLAGASVDIGQLKQLQERLAAAERMESLGRMASGLAHEFNNLMTVIMGCAAFARQSPDQLSEAMNDIDEAAARASVMTEQLLMFARRQPVERIPLAVGPMVRESCEWLRGALAPHIEVVADLGRDVPLVDADSALLGQVIMNLAANGRDAMPGGGTLTIALERSDRGLILMVRDTGCGMTAHAREHALEPFFTTKPNAAGLGLATAYGLASELGGELIVRSDEGVGTTVEIHLPASGVAPDPAMSSADVRTKREALVLVVDDEAAIRKVLEQFLTRSGFRVRLASSGDEALRLLDDDIEIVVSDVRMPGMEGSALAEAIRAERPTLPILLMSGYSEHAVERAEGTAFIAKPFDLDRLINVISTLLRG